MPRKTGANSVNRAELGQPSRDEKSYAQSNTTSHRDGSRQSGDISHGPSPSELSFATASSSGSRRQRNGKRQKPAEESELATEKKTNSVKDGKYNDAEEIEIDEDYTVDGDEGGSGRADEGQSKPSRRRDEKSKQPKNDRPSRTTMEDFKEEEEEQSDNDTVKLDEVEDLEKKTNTKQASRQAKAKSDKRNVGSAKSSPAGRYAGRPMRSTAKAVIASMTPRGFKDRVRPKAATGNGKKPSTSSDHAWDRLDEKSDTEDSEERENSSTTTSDYKGKAGRKDVASTRASGGKRGKAIQKSAAGGRGGSGQFRQNPRRNVRSAFMPGSRASSRKEELAGIASDEDISDADDAEMPDEEFEDYAGAEEENDADEAPQAEDVENDRAENDALVQEH